MNYQTAGNMRRNGRRGSSMHENYHGEKRTYEKIVGTAVVTTCQAPLVRQIMTGKILVLFGSSIRSDVIESWGALIT